MFSLASCDWIGFDLDHTLIRYRLKELHTLIYRLMSEYLVNFHEYNRRLLDIAYDEEFGVKALIYDGLYGNLIQLDSNGLVHTAWHGTCRRLSPTEIKESYPNALEAIEEDPSKRFLCIFTYFDHAISYLLGNLVDMIDQENLYEECSTNRINFEGKFSFFLKDLRAGFDYLFGDFNRGNYFSTLRENPQGYVYPRPDVRCWLEKLKQSGKKLFLATNSRADYTDLLNTFAFGKDWKDLFEVIIVDCKKPLFFTESNKQVFQRLTDDHQQSIPVTVEEMIELFDTNPIYAFGNSDDLHSVMSRISEKDPVVIYFGDHIKSDINALKRHTNWLAGAVIEELEYDTPPTVIHTTTHHSSKELAASEQAAYVKGNRSKYFASFFTSPAESIHFDCEDTAAETKMEQTDPDAVLPALSSYWYTYITKHAHLSLSCLSVLANHFDLDQEFHHDPQTEHFILMHQNK